MTGYAFTLSCRLCNGALSHLADGLSTGTEASAVARCVPCRRDYVVTAFVTPIDQPEQRRARERKRAARLVEVAG